MNRIYLFFVGVFFMNFGAYSQQGSPTFKTINEFLTWADDKFEKNDYEALVVAQCDSKDQRETRLSYIRQVDADIGTSKLTAIFRDREFPSNADSYKLGGHFKELGCGHLDFVKRDDGWQALGSHLAVQMKSISEQGAAANP